MYGILIATGMVIANYTCRIKEVNYDDFLNNVLIYISISIIGTRLYYAVFAFENYKNNIIEVFNIRQGGLVIHGALIFGLISPIIYTERKK